MSEGYRAPAREELLRAKRPRKLPIIPNAAEAARSVPLTATPTAVDKVRPIYCVWEVTLACDLACRHCGSRAGRARPDELNRDDALDLASQLVELGIKEVTLIGGEAYMRDDWLDLIRFFSKAGVATSMTTGGRSLTADMARAAADAGLRGASVSLEACVRLTTVCAESRAPSIRR